MSTTYGGGDFYVVAHDEQWKLGLARMAPELTSIAFERMRAACEQGLDAARESVHVRTGALRASGRMVTEGLKVAVEFGGGEVDYAGWHEIEYPYLEPAMTQALATFGA